MALAFGPTNLVATAQTGNNSHLSWTNNNPYDYIEVWKKEGGGSWSLKATIDGDRTSHVHSGGGENVTLEYRIRGKYTVGYDPPEYTEFSNTDSCHYWTSVPTTESLTLTDSYSDVHVADLSDTITETLTLSETVSDVATMADTVSETLTLTDTYQDSQSLRIDYSYFLGSSDGKLYLYAPTNYSDAGTSISSHWRSKTTDFSEQYPEYINQFYTVYGAKLVYVDKSADTAVTLYYSTDGGTTWTSGGMNTVGNGDGSTKDTNFYFIETGKYFDFKIEHGSTTNIFQWIALELDILPRGESRQIS